MELSFVDGLLIASHAIAWWPITALIYAAWAATLTGALIVWAIVTYPISAVVVSAAILGLVQLYLQQRSARPWDELDD